jgi:hypothetical protein
MRLFRERVSGDVFGPNRDGELRSGRRHESGAQGRHNDEPSRLPGSFTSRRLAV